MSNFKNLNGKPRIGQVRLVRNADNSMGHESHYWHLVANNGGGLEHLLLSEQQYVEARGRGDRAHEVLPMVSTWEMLKLRLPIGSILIAILLTIILMATGCSTPSSAISSNPVTGEVSLRIPKDASWDLLTYERFSDGKTNYVKLSISNANFKMNPEVISAQSRREADMFKLGMEVGQKAIQAGVAGAMGNHAGVIGGAK